MRINLLTIENFKRISAVQIKPDGSVIEITGKNGNGKSSVLDAIASALGGTTLCPSDPIRHGSDKAEVSVDLGDLIVTRRWWLDKHGDTKTDLRVTSADGARFSNPQQVLNELYGRLAFDPLAFSRMKPKEQFEQLKDLAGLDFTQLDQRYQSQYDARRDTNRDLKQAEARLAGMLRPTDVPDSPPDQTKLRAEHAAAMQERKRQEGIADDLKYQLDKRVLITAEIESLKAQLVRLDGDIAELESQAKNFVDPNPDQYIEAMTKAGEAVELIAKARAYDEAEREVMALRSQAKAIDDDMAAMKQARTDAINAATFPVPGLSIDAENECVMCDGVPFEQASGAERIRTSAAIGLANNKPLKLMLIHDGSLLDSESRGILAEMADEAGAQVIVERVTDGEPIGIVIEDGTATVHHAAVCESKQ